MSEDRTIEVRIYVCIMLGLLDTLNRY